MKKILCTALSGALVISMVCSVPVRAEETGSVFLMDDAALKEETDRGGYVICVEDGANSSIEQSEDMTEIPVGSDSKIGRAHV